MKTRTFVINFYLEGNEDAGFYAWISQRSPKEESGWGATVNEAVSNLCRLLNSEFTEPIERGKIAPTGRKDKTTSELKRGTQIIYVPTHANGDIHHTDCQAGFIASPTILPGNAIFCRFWANGSVPRRLRTLANSEATPIENLVVRDTVPLQDVKAAIKILMP